MPHFVIHCSQNVLQQASSKSILQCVFKSAEATNLFGKGDIKVRLTAFEEFIAGDGNDDFIHVFANIMQGRTTEQKKALSSAVCKNLKLLLPDDVALISINIIDFEKATYCNKKMI